MWLAVLIVVPQGWALSTPTTHPLPPPLPRVRRAGPAMASAGEDPAPPSLQLSASDPRVVSVTLDRVTGIDFGCDLSLRWPYVLSLVPDGAAARSGELQLGDQLLAVGGISVIGAAIGDAMDTMAKIEGSTIDLLFFRGSRDSLQQLAGAATDAVPDVRVTVQQPGKPDVEFMVPYGSNLRDELIARKINVYQSLTRWTNCNGKQLCGTCIVDVAEGIDSCTRRSIDEASTLRENPPTYKLACITNVYGDVVVRLTPKVGAAQWTR